MSFFVKASTKKHLSDRFKKRKFEQVSKKSRNDDEISSSEDDDNNEITTNLNGDNNYSSDDDENETAQEKKLRLAKIYLQEIEKEEKQRLDDNDNNGEINHDVISERLKEDYLKQAGRLKSSVADKYTGVSLSEIKVLKCREQKNVVTCMCISADDQWVFSGSKDGVVVKWSINDQKKLGYIPFIKKHADGDSKILGHNSRILSIAISSDNNFLAVGTASPTVYIWNPTNLEYINKLNGHRGSISGLSFQRNTHTLYSASSDRSIRVWSLDEMAFVESLFGHQDTITDIDAMYSHRPISAGGRDGTVRLWKVSEESQLIYNAAPGNVDAVTLISEHNFLTGSDDGLLSVWSCLKKKPLCSQKNAHGLNPINLQPYWISAVASLKNTDLIASGSQDGYLRLWKLGDNFRTISLLFEVEIIGFINSIVFTSNGTSLIAGCGKEHKLGRWNTVKSAVNSIVVIPLLLNDNDN